MQVLVRRAYSGWGYYASAASAGAELTHGAGFDEAVAAFAAKQQELVGPDGSPPVAEQLTVTLVWEEYGQYLLEVRRR